MKIYKTFLTLVVLCSAIISCSQKKLVSTQINFMQPYCGGARPTPEIIADAEKAKPLYEEVITKHEDSIHYVTSQKKYRKLRGDSI
jgi:hypothetical protein